MSSINSQTSWNPVKELKDPISGSIILHERAWNPVKELKDTELQFVAPGKRLLVWNPVKELKGVRDAGERDDRFFRWNPVKELKDIRDRRSELRMERWNPVKELKVMTGWPYIGAHSSSRGIR